MARMRKCTEAQWSSYAVNCGPIYPLYGWINVRLDDMGGSVDVPVEFAGGNGKTSPKYEIVAPDGWHFDEGPHALCCFDKKDVEERIKYNVLVRCSEDTCAGACVDRDGNYADADKGMARVRFVRDQE